MEHRQSVLCLVTATVLLALAAVPSAHAAISSGIVSVDRLAGDCAAEIDLVPLLARLLFDPRLTAPMPEFLSGSKLTIQEGSGNDARVRRTGPLGDGAFYSHQQTSIVNTYEYDAFTLGLSQYFDDARVSIVARNPTWLSASSADGFQMATRGPVTSAGDPGDPRHPFVAEPAAPLLTLTAQSLSFAGELRILIENSAFTVTTDAHSDAYEARYESVIGSNVDAENVRYFVLLVEGARLDLRNTNIGADLFAGIVDIACLGSLLDASSETPTLVAQGALDLAPRQSTSDPTVLDVPYTITETDPGAPESANVGVARSAFPYWAILLAVGLVGTGGGAAVWRFVRRAPGAPTPEPAVSTAPPAPATVVPRDIPELEGEYRRDPGNPVLTLELGLAYARKSRPHDALPLLQMAIQHYPKMDAVRYFTGIALLEIGRVEEGITHLAYSFRLNALNVARFINEGAAQKHGLDARVRVMLARWSRQFQESNARGYA